MRFVRILFFLVLIGPAYAQQQQFGEIGDLKLASGEILCECRICSM
jgi:hypothetical protein